MKTRAPTPAVKTQQQPASKRRQGIVSSSEALVSDAQTGADMWTPLQRMRDSSPQGGHEPIGDRSPRALGHAALQNGISGSPRGVTQRRAIAQLFGPSVIQRAGDPEGLMPEHHASGFTYHHIIPENKLHSLWETLESQGHTGQLKGGLGSVVGRGLGQLTSASTGNIKRDLNKEIGEITQAWDDTKFEAVVADAIAGESPEALTRKYFPGLEDPKHEFHGSYLNIKTIFNKRFKVIGESTGKAVTDTVAAEGQGFLADKSAKTVVNKLLMWMPGNIHRGPSKRFTPADASFDKDVDDGGDSFEEAAKQIISADHFKTISALDKKIDIYLGNPTDTKVLPEIGALLEAMKAYSVTDYDPANWEEVSVGTKKSQKKAWRLKKKS